MKLARNLCAAAASLLLIPAGCAAEKPAKKRAGKSTEAYIAFGGTGAAVLEWNDDQVTATSEMRWAKNFPDDQTIKVTAEGNKLTLTRVFSDGSDEFSYIFQESEDHPSDYDLIGIQYPMPDFLIDFETMEEVDSASSPGLQFSQHYHEQHMERALHLIDDERAANFILAMERGDYKSTESCTTSASELQQAHPSDPFLKSAYLNLLAHMGELGLLEKQHLAWHEELSDHSNDSIRSLDYQLSQFIEANKLARAGKNPWAMVSAWTTGAVGLAQIMRDLPALLNAEYLMLTDPPGMSSQYNFLELQTLTKTARVESQFALMDGRRDDALDMLLATYHMGQLLEQNSESEIAVLIGAAIRAIAAGGLEHLVLNASETPAHLADAIHRMGEVAAKRKSASPSLVRDIKSLMNDDMILRPNVSTSIYNLVKAAAGVRYSLLATGQFPESLESASTLLSPPPPDPFSNGPVLYRNESPTTAIVYSIGPDKRDDQAAFEYDPTNGTVSPGDIIVRIPHEREFPYPKGGLRASTLAELNAQMPNGLPLDTFGYNKTDTFFTYEGQPLLIYSVGPDGLGGPGSTGSPGSRKDYKPDTPYDPTNGTSSHGDLIFLVPPRGANGGAAN